MIAYLLLCNQYSHTECAYTHRSPAGHWLFCIHASKKVPAGGVNSLQLLLL